MLYSPEPTRLAEFYRDVICIIMIKYDSFIDIKQNSSNYITVEKEFVDEELKESERIDFDGFLDNLFRDRINVASALGKSSFEGRIKAMKVSLVNSFSNLWLGNGAGTSQKLLPSMIEDLERANIQSTDRKQITRIKNNTIKVLLEKKLISPEYRGNRSLIDSHNLFLTEFFNVGIIGASALLIMVSLILYKQFRVIMKNSNKIIT